MQFDLSLPQDELYFSQYTEDFIEIKGQKYTAPIRVDYTQVTLLSELNFDALEQVILQDALTINPLPEVIIVGCGAKQKFIHPKAIAKLASNGIGIEIMHTPAAIKTFNLLKMDDRRVWAWIFPNKA